MARGASAGCSPRPMRQDELGAELSHVDVIVDDHIATHGTLREPGPDLLSAPGAGSAGRVLSTTRPVNSSASSITCSSATVLPCRQVDETTTSARALATISFNTWMHAGSRSPYRGQHAVDVEKDHPSRHVILFRSGDLRVTWVATALIAARAGRRGKCGLSA